MIVRKNIYLVIDFLSFRMMVSQVTGQEEVILDRITTVRALVGEFLFMMNQMPFQVRIRISSETAMRTAQLSRFGTILDAELFSFESVSFDKVFSRCRLNRSSRRWMCRSNMIL